jgi:hypothetical protein
MKKEAADALPSCKSQGTPRGGETPRTRRRSPFRGTPDDRSPSYETVSVHPNGSIRSEAESGKPISRPAWSRRLGRMAPETGSS